NKVKSSNKKNFSEIHIYFIAKIPEALKAKFTYDEKCTGNNKCPFLLSTLKAGLKIVGRQGGIYGFKADIYKSHHLFMVHHYYYFFDSNGLVVF
ncbi:MAG TPA: hypothetical protein VLB84_10595, partial [Bacteroidia bacterium]|nr:hypothetical protein [Bacteroidia bacterium]